MSQTPRDSRRTPGWPMPFGEPDTDRGPGFPWTEFPWKRLVLALCALHYGAVLISVFTGNFDPAPNHDHVHVARQVLAEGLPSIAIWPPGFGYYVAFKMAVSSWLEIPYWTGKLWADVVPVVASGVLSAVLALRLTQNRLLAFFSGVGMVAAPIFAFASTEDLAVVLFQPFFLGALIFLVGGLQRGEPDRPRRLLRSPESPGSRRSEGSEESEKSEKSQGSKGSEGPEGPEGSEAPEGPETPEGSEAPEGPEGPEGIPGIRELRGFPGSLEFLGFGALLGLSCLIRGNPQFLIPVLAPVVWWVFRRAGRARPLRSAALAVALALGAQALVLLPWSLLQRATTEESGVFSAPVVYYSYFDGMRRHEGFAVSDALRADPDPPPHSLQGVFELNAEWLRRDPGALAKVYGVKLLRTWYLSDSGRWDRWILLLHAPWWLLGLAGAVRWWRRARGDPAPVLILVTIGYLWAVSALVSGLARYMAPVYGLLALLAGVALEPHLRRCIRTAQVPSDFNGRILPGTRPTRSRSRRDPRADLHYDRIGLERKERWQGRASMFLGMSWPRSVVGITCGSSRFSDLC